jgi:hypothetical protein
MTTTIEMFNEYVVFRNWIFEMLSKRKTQKSRDAIIYLIHMVYVGFLKYHLKLGVKLFLEEASQEVFGKKLSRLYKDLDETGIQNINCLLFHEKLNNTFRNFENEDKFESQ